MTYQEEKKVRLRRQGSKQAIALAMQGRWREAVAANQSVIESFPNDVEAYNRLGKAYMELGEYTPSKEAYARALELDSYNAIAKKNLQRLSHLEGAEGGFGGGSSKAEPQHFIEETGKAGVVNLSSLAPPEILARVMAGDKVSLRVEGHSLIVENESGEYVGQVDPRYGQRLIGLMEGGNKYAAAIVSSAEGIISVIIREVYQDPGRAGLLSFPARRFEGVQPYVSDRIFRRGLEYGEELSEAPDTTVVGEEETEVLPKESSETGEDQPKDGE